MLDCNRIFFCSMFILSSAKISDIEGLDLFNPGISFGPILELRLCRAAVGEAVVDIPREALGPFCNPGNEGNGIPGIIIPGGRKGFDESPVRGPTEVGVPDSPVKGCLRRLKA